MDSFVFLVTGNRGVTLSHHHNSGSLRRNQSSAAKSQRQKEQETITTQTKIINGTHVYGKENKQTNTEKNIEVDWTLGWSSCGSARDLSRGGHFRSLSQFPTISRVMIIQKKEREMEMVGGWGHIRSPAKWRQNEHHMKEGKRWKLIGWYFSEGGKASGGKGGGRMICNVG